MDLPNALRAMVGNTGLRATRPTRTIIKINFRNKVEVYARDGWYRWQPAFNDMVASDWEVMPEQRLIELISSEMAAANAAAQAE